MTGHVQTPPSSAAPTATSPSPASRFDIANAAFANAALALRVGMGTLFLIGGWNKLSKLLMPSTSDALVASYTATTGYINEFFMAYLFGPGSVLSPWTFLTALSTFELVSGVMLIAGLLVRPLALIYAFLLWTFVVSLPVVTTNGVEPGVKTYMAPALLVQIRDVGLSGLMFALYALGSGHRSLDLRLFGPDAAAPLARWETIGLLMRLSLAVVLIVGGLFAGMPNIKAWLQPGVIMLLAAALLLWGGRIGQLGAAAGLAIVTIYSVGKLSFDAGLVGNLNAIKREIAFIAAFAILTLRDSGPLWTASDVARRLREAVQARNQMRSADAASLGS
ncbi:MAG: DoxX family membrane protein [Pseudomonadota bacterium]